MSVYFDYYDEEALIDRLSKGLMRRRQEVIFLVGAPLSAPLSMGQPGVPDVDGVISLIRKEFEDDPSQFEEAVRGAGRMRYQVAFQFLQGRRGQQAANEIVRAAVRGARLPDSPTVGGDPIVTEDACRLLDSDAAGWFLSPGSESLGRLIAGYPERFGRSVLTTNFDPLIEVAVRRAGGQFFRTTLHLV